MFKPTALKLILGLVLAGGFTFVALNAHIDIFPCVKREMDFTTNKVQTREGTCSLLYLYNQDHMQGEGGELTGAGYGVAAAALGLVPLLVGFMIGHAIGRKKS